MKEQFVHLHVHSTHSLLDGCARVEDYVRAAAERGNPAIALTDHGTMRGAYELTERCNAYGVKPIYGIEFNVCHDMRRRGLTDEEKERAKQGVSSKAEQKERVKRLEESEGIRRYYHLTAWALDDEGLRNLYRLSSKSWSEGFYYCPRIDLNALCEHHRGLLVGTGCVGSLVYGQHWEKRMGELDTALWQLVDTFGDRLYLELMPHDLSEGRQSEANNFACQLHELTGGRHKFLATQDAHYLAREDSGHHDVLLAMQTNSSINDSDRFSFDGDQYWLKTRDEMWRSFDESHGFLGEGIINAALRNTVELAERCTAKIEIDPLKALLPSVDVPEQFEGDESAYLRSLVMQGVELRDLRGRAKRLARREGVKVKTALKRYTARLARELDVLSRSGFVRYFLILHDLYRWVGTQGIACGPGRGSAAGSLVSYLLGITHVDPIEHRLMFERFIAPGRVNMPDIDCFPAGTEVWTEWGQEPIENVQVGTSVFTRAGLKRVTHFHRRPTRDGEGLTEIRLRCGDVERRMRCTPSHPFFQRVDTSVKAVKAEECKPGQRVFCFPELWKEVPFVFVSFDGSLECCELAEIIYVCHVEASCDVYDLTVEDQHEYVADGVLVHNCDFEDERRGEIVEYLKRKYGEDRVAQISTMTRMQGRQVVKDVARVFNVNYQRVNVATSGIDSSESDNAIETALASSELFRRFADEYPDVVAHSRALEGMTKISGVHAAGVVTSPVPLVDVVPLEVRRPAGKEQVVTAFDMRGVEGIGLLKIDVLGLKAVTMLRNAERAVSERLEAPFRLLDLSIEDRKTLSAFTQRDFIGIFQFDSPSASAICDGLEFNCFDDIVVVNSINRPGAKDFANEYKRRRKDPKLAERHVFHPKVTEITRDALGLMIYQEHVIRVCTDVAGMDASIADKLRKKIGKSEGHEALEKDRHEFVSGCVRATPDMSEETANRLFDAIVRFGRYGFNRCIDVSTRVVTRRGDVDASELQVGDSILGFADGKARWETVVRVWPPEMAGRHYLKFEDGSDFVCTSEHCWLTQAGIKYTSMIVDEGWPVVQIKEKPRLRRLTKWRRLPPGPVVDIEVSGNHLFVLANGLVSHNSHAVCYSLLGYWTQYLKQHHPLEFYWSMMQREGDRKKLQRLVRDAEHHDVRTLLPDVNVSGADFVIDRGEGAIRGSLLDIENVGKVGVTAIEAARVERPFSSFSDFCERTRGRAVTRKTIKALLESGALDTFIPNPRWAQSEFSTLWNRIDAKRWEEVEKRLTASASKEQWSYDERMKAAAIVNPLALRAHPCITWESFLRNKVRPELQEINDTLLATKQDVYCAGLIIEMEQRTVGDTKSLDEFPPEEVRKRLGWGKPWFRFTIEGLQGRAWARLDWRQSQYFTNIWDSGIGTAVVICGETDPKWSNLYIHFMADVEELARKMKADEALTIWERLFVDHPSLTYPWKTKADKRVALGDSSKLAEATVDDEWFRVIGVVARLFETVDRNGRRMAWFGLAGVMGYQRVVCFGSAWDDFRDSIRLGRLVGVTLRKLESGEGCLELRPRAVTIYRKEEVFPSSPLKERPKLDRQVALYDDDIPF